MSVPPKSIKVGRCYLSYGCSGQMRRVVRISPEGLVQYETQAPSFRAGSVWAGGALDLALFASSVEREVPCDWSPEAIEENP